MEVVVFICMLIVPFVSLAALALTIMERRRVENLRNLVMKLARAKDGEDPVRDFLVSDM